MKQSEGELYLEFKTLLDKDARSGKFSELEADYLREYVRLTSLANLLLDITLEEYRRKKRLKREPRGFHFDADKTYTCMICHQVATGHEGWWDKYGPKCMNCQRNLDKGVAPKKILKHRDSWFERWHLKDKFGLHPATVSKLIREGKLKSRDFKDEGGAIYLQIFLEEENNLDEILGKTTSIKAS